MPVKISLVISSASAHSQASLSGPRLALDLVSDFPLLSMLRVPSVGADVDASDSGPAKRTRADG